MITERKGDWRLRKTKGHAHRPPNINTPGWEWGIDYSYFCVNDTQNVNWVDGNVTCDQGFGFLACHTPFTRKGGGIVPPFTLPQRSETEFQKPGQLQVRDVFYADGYKYGVAGYNTVQFAGGIVTDGVLDIPETVTHNGRSYTVISIGRVDENGLYGQGAVTEGYITRYRIPKTVNFIWDSATQTSEGYVTAYEVDPDSPYFASPDGVLYTKSLYTLVSYPHNAPWVDRYVIPDETVNIACDSLRCISTIGQLVLGKNVKLIGVTNWGSGYADGPTNQMQSIGIGELCGLTIDVSPENPYYRREGNLIFSLVNGQLHSVYLAASAGVTDVSIPDGITQVCDFAFLGCCSIQSFSIPSSVTYLGSCLTSGNQLSHIDYRGTTEQWNELIRCSSFGNWIPPMEIVCIDGTVTLP